MRQFALDKTVAIWRINWRKIRYHIESETEHADFTHVSGKI
jgi:hypothetical protein